MSEFMHETSCKNYQHQFKLNQLILIEGDKGHSFHITTSRQVDIFVVIVMVYKPKLTNTFSSTKMIVKLLLQISSVLLTIFHLLHFLFCFCSLVKYAFLKED